MHSKQECDICKKDFKTSMEVIIHKAKEHHKEEGTWNVKANSIPKEGSKDISFIINNSMLDDIQKFLKTWNMEEYEKYQGY